MMELQQVQKHEMTAIQLVVMGVAQTEVQSRQATPAMVALVQYEQVEQAPIQAKQHALYNEAMGSEEVQRYVTTATRLVVTAAAATV